MKSVYIGVSALFRAYKEESGSDVMDYLYGLMEPDCNRTCIPVEHSGYSKGDNKKKELGRDFRG